MMTNINVLVTISNHASMITIIRPERNAIIFLISVIYIAHILFLSLDKIL